MVICVSPDLKVSSIGELAALSKVKPDGLYFAANARGTLPHLTAERFVST